MAAIIVMLITWAFLALLIVAMFFKRLRQDVLEFNRAWWFGLLAFIMMFIYVGVSGWPEWIAVLAGGGGAGLLAGLSFMIIYAVTESLNREVWQDRLALTDVLFRGFFRVREFGSAILIALFLTGFFLALIGGVYWWATETTLGYLSLDEEVFWIFAGNAATLPNLFKNVLATIVVTLVLFAFGASYLKSRIQNKVALIIVFGLVINLAGFSLYYLRSSYWGFFLFLPIAIAWAYCVFRFDLVTILLATFFVNLFLEMSLIGLLPNGLLSAPGLVGLSLVFLTLVSGSYFVHSKRSLKDFEKYIPQYVNRIVQRERFHRELEIAQSVQQRFLPQSVPSFPDLDIASICRPALEVGGDYYDFICNGDKCLGVVIGDVSGKGVSAAFYMTMVKGIIKTLTKTAMSPKEMLTEMNTIFYENAPNHVFISMIYGLFDLENNTLTFARAGHNPVIFRTSQGDKPATLHPKGLAIGLEKGNIFSQTIEEISLSLNKGDTFLFFTDGISESMNPKGDEFGEERLHDIIDRNGECSANTLMKK
ncbi:PP2C family protein-serine/threonine phosphatase, partial [bacterium]|nr:PP2C family protein-serine/threonine phosphatase [bacterium]